MNPDAYYWNQHYLEGNTGWDLGGPSPPIQEYFDQIEDKTVSILFPGAGIAHDALALFEKEFFNVFILDFAPEPLNRIKDTHPDFPEDHLLYEDFFSHRGSYDFVVEQTLFCAVDPSLREKYAKTAASLLGSSGKLVGVLFNRDFEGGPPFGGSASEYATYFAPHFRSVEMYDCYNSIEPRQGSELFIRMSP